MARKTKEDAQATRNAILAAAVEVFRERGVSRSRLEDIAKRANVTRGAVYWHFEGKVDLLIALTESITVPIYDDLARLAAQPGDDPLGAWREQLLACMRQLVETPAIHGIVDILINHCEFNDDIADLRELEHTRNRLFLDKTRALLDHARAAGQIDGQVDLDALALTVHGLIHGLMRLWLRFPGNLDLVDAIERGLDLILAGVRAAR